MTPNSDLTADVAKTLAGRYGKVRGSVGFYYGQIIQVHASGEYLLFQRGRRFKPKWYHRLDVFPHGALPDSQSGAACYEHPALC